MIVAFDPAGLPRGFLPTWDNRRLGCLVTLRFVPTTVNPLESSIWGTVLVTVS
jgi:hypothetical protein